MATPSDLRPIQRALDQRDSVKQYRSKFLRTVALAFLFFPLSYLLWSVIVFDVPSAKFAELFLSPVFYAVAGWMILTGYGLWEMRRWVWWTLLLGVLFVTYENINVLVHQSESQHKGFVFVFSGFVSAFVFLRVSRELRVPYFLPSIAWWEADVRGRFQSPAVIRTSDESLEPRTGKLLDLSVVGCFVQSANRFKQEEEVTVEFTVYDIEVALHGLVVWRAESSVTHPAGIGIRFLRLSKEQRKQVRLILMRRRQLHRLTQESAS